jgi:hypothetical protein
MELNGRMIDIRRTGKKWRELLKTYSALLPQNVAGVTEEICEKLNQSRRSPSRDLDLESPEY